MSGQDPYDLQRFVDAQEHVYERALAEIKSAKYVLTPGRYVGAAEAEHDGEEIDAKIERLTKELLAALDGTERAAALVRSQLERVDV